MTLAFVLYKYFPFGGLQRDFLRIALECQRRGHVIRVYCLEWQGELPQGFELNIAPVRAFSSHRRNQKFSQWLSRQLQQRPAERVIGFNKMPGLDFYFAADGCLAEKTHQSSWLRHLSGRYRHFLHYEQAVFSAQSATQILLIAKMQQPLFIAHYQTPPNRLHLLPPGLGQDRKRPLDGKTIRADFRREWQLEEGERLLLCIGSGFKTKGVDRSIKALAALPGSLKQRTQLFVIGEDNPKAFVKLAKQQGVGERVRFLGGRDDIARFLLGADLLIHPAYFESAGAVLLEALVFGLPVLVTDICGYAHYIREAKAGWVLPSPFMQQALVERLEQMLTDDDERAHYAQNALAFAGQVDLYRLPQHAADLILA
ncbi:glucosyltransferase I RfaG [Ventosimonas gracilis]|uniref:Glucosyltransferase I RfaG n=1 Tax=Ventosimonas gracilis TaxID=1680762 RepID=A0A139SV02_9GAMM|nr:glycosyltransferase family 4 protein [Ventosimonas gracilis]KXU38436.1 glucosyltransferase I RfaG [Ventosimonas gracilis]